MNKAHDLILPNSDLFALEPRPSPRMSPANSHVLARYVPPSALQSVIEIVETPESQGSPVYQLLRVSAQAREAGFEEGQLICITPGRRPTRVSVDGEQWAVFLHHEILGIYDAPEAARM